LHAGHPVCQQRKRVPYTVRVVSMVANNLADANLFKEAFIKAQQENEALFKADAPAEPKEEAAEAKTEA